MTQRGHLVFATVTGVRDVSITYPCCVGCYSKLLCDTTEDSWHCLKCGKSYNSNQLSWRFRLPLTIADQTSAGHVTVFGKTLDSFFGGNAKEFRRKMVEVEKSGFPAEVVLTQALAETFIGQHFYFGFKLTGFSKSKLPVNLNDVLAAVQIRGTQGQYDKMDSIAYQMILATDLKLTTVLDQIRYLVLVKGGKSNLNKTSSQNDGELDSSGTTVGSLLLNESKKSESQSRSSSWSYNFKQDSVQFSVDSSEAETDQSMSQCQKDVCRQNSAMQGCYSGTAILPRHRNHTEVHLDTENNNHFFLEEKNLNRSQGDSCASRKGPEVQEFPSSKACDDSEWVKEYITCTDEVKYSENKPDGYSTVAPLSHSDCMGANLNQTDLLLNCTDKAEVSKSKTKMSSLEVDDIEVARGSYGDTSRTFSGYKGFLHHSAEFSALLDSNFSSDTDSIMLHLDCGSKQMHQTIFPAIKVDETEKRTPCVKDGLCCDVNDDCSLKERANRTRMNGSTFICNKENSRQYNFKAGCEVAAIAMPESEDLEALFDSQSLHAEDLEEEETLNLPGVDPKFDGQLGLGSKKIINQEDVRTGNGKTEKTASKNLTIKQRHCELKLDNASVTCGDKAPGENAGEQLESSLNLHEASEINNFSHEEKMCNPSSVNSSRTKPHVLPASFIDMPESEDLAAFLDSFSGDDENTSDVGLVSQGDDVNGDAEFVGKRYVEREKNAKSQSETSKCPNFSKKNNGTAALRNLHDESDHKRRKSEKNNHSTLDSFSAWADNLMKGDTIRDRSKICESSATIHTVGTEILSKAESVILKEISHSAEENRAEKGDRTEDSFTAWAKNLMEENALHGRSQSNFEMMPYFDKNVDNISHDKATCTASEPSQSGSICRTETRSHRSVQGRHMCTNATGSFTQWARNLTEDEECIRSDKCTPEAELYIDKVSSNDLSDSGASLVLRKLTDFNTCPDDDEEDDDLGESYLAMYGKMEEPNENVGNQAISANVTICGEMNESTKAEGDQVISANLVICGKMNQPTESVVSVNHANYKQNESNNTSNVFTSEDEDHLHSYLSVDCDSTNVDIHNVGCVLECDIEDEKEIGEETHSLTEQHSNSWLFKGNGGQTCQIFNSRTSGKPLKVCLTDIYVRSSRDSSKLVKANGADFLSSEVDLENLDEVFSGSLSEVTESVQNVHNNNCIQGSSSSSGKTEENVLENVASFTSQNSTKEHCKVEKKVCDNQDNVNKGVSVAEGVGDTSLQFDGSCDLFDCSTGSINCVENSQQFSQSSHLIHGNQSNLYVICNNSVYDKSIRDFANVQSDTSSMNFHKCPTTPGTLAVGESLMSSPNTHCDKSTIAENVHVHNKHVYEGAENENVDSEYQEKRRKKVRFDYRLRRVSSIQLIDLKMRLTSSPVKTNSGNSLIKSCLKTTALEPNGQDGFDGNTNKHMLSDLYEAEENGESINKRVLQTPTDTIIESQDLFSPSPIPPANSDVHVGTNLYGADSVITPDLWSQKDLFCDPTPCLVSISLLPKTSPKFNVTHGTGNRKEAMERMCNQGNNISASTSSKQRKKHSGCLGKVKKHTADKENRVSLKGGIILNCSPGNNKCQNQTSLFKPVNTHVELVKSKGVQSLDSPDLFESDSELLPDSATCDSSLDVCEPTPMKSNPNLCKKLFF